MALVTSVRRVLLLIGALLATAVPADAGQSVKFKWWHDERFVRELKLTPEQSAKIDEVFQTSWPALKAAKTDLDRLESELSQLIAEGTAGETVVLKQIDRVEASRSAMGRTRSLMLYRIHRVLTREQREQLKALNAERDRDRDRDSHGSSHSPR